MTNLSATPRRRRRNGLETASSPQVLIDETDDKPVAVKRYFTAAQLAELRRQKTLVLQCYWRGFCARRRTWAIRQRLYDARVARESGDADGEDAKTRRRRREVERRVNPRTQQDFELLYNELDAWRAKEMAVATGAGARADVLARETRALQTIDRLKASAAADGRAKRVSRVMDLMALPKKWEGADGELKEVHTPFTTRALELRDLHTGLGSSLPLDDRLQVLLNVKWTVQEFPCALTRDIVELCDREADLLNRGRQEKSLAGLRKRTEALFRQFVDTPDFNPESTRFLKVPTLRQHNTLMD